MNLEREDVKLVIKIDNKKPVELLDLTKSLIAIANQFSGYVQKNGETGEHRKAKLYVQEIKTGSIIVDLVEYATIGMLPFAENVNTIVGFATFLQKTFTYFIKSEGNKPNLSNADYKDFQSIVNPVAKDSAAQYNISPIVNGNVTFNFPINSTEANAIQNKIKLEMGESKIPELQKDKYEKVVMTLYQARSDIKSKDGNKGVVESISDKPLKLIFENDTIKESILLCEANPLSVAFVVDVNIQNVQSKPAAYKITKMHEYFEID